ncbi:glutathione transferase [Amantichitinum ursilacus]|uniref:Glutathione S-transferase YfcF n=1 Tax=Amantichitinum ursilacus TaxID=857265 RepID=A0A0N0XKW7_9NEIS|nr:glutathione transferase [Amantichitinum ursilacus]KPC52728.1 Glutathione S-transferase YfcF [Amantichitinum ursilacus]
MSNPQLTLYVGADFVSVFAMSAFVALTEKELEFDIVKVDLKQRANYLPDYTQLSITNKVPTLVHNGFNVSESSAIAEYLDETFAETGRRALYPKAAHDRARARQIQAWLRSDLLVVRKERPADLIYFGKKETPLSDEARVAVDKLFRVANQLLDHGSDPLFGEWSIADTDLAVMLNRLVANGDEVPANLAAYVQKQWQRNSVQRWVQQTR